MCSLHLFRISALIEGFKGILFTGKLVKTIIFHVMPEAKDLFLPSKTGSPKLVHVSPLYSFENGKIRCVYSSIDCKGDTAKCNDKPYIIELNGIYSFYVGFSDKVLDYDKFFNSINCIDGCFEFMEQKVCVSLHELEYINVEEAMLEISKRILNNGKLKIIFSSPTMLRDPFKRTKHKSLIPTIFNVFSTPVFLNLYTSGTYSLRRYRRQLLILHKLFNESYTTLKTIKLKWVRYKHKPEPTIIGYMNLYINYDYLQYYERHINIKKYLGEILAYMSALGVGVGRATGFGHVFIKTNRM